MVRNKNNFIFKFTVRKNVSYIYIYIYLIFSTFMPDKDRAKFPVTFFLNKGQEKFNNVLM